MQSTTIPILLWAIIVPVLLALVGIAWGLLFTLIRDFRWFIRALRPTRTKTSVTDGMCEFICPVILPDLRPWPERCAHWAGRGHRGPHYDTHGYEFRNETDPGIVREP